MCRHAAWLGAPRTLAEVVLEQEFGLLRQSYRPRRQAHGLMNADGWGVGFLGGAGTSAAPARWRGAGPLWAEASFASVAPHIRSGCILAAVRSASVGMPADETAAAPFLYDGWLLSHNGVVDRDVLPADAWTTAESVCDSAVLAAYLLARPAEIGARVSALGRRDRDARLNVLATDGRRLVATTWGDTLSVLETDDGVAVASEPWDDDARWSDVPDRTLVSVERADELVHVSYTPLEDSR
jgi:glutamine amidotransferase